MGKKSYKTIDKTNLLCYNLYRIFIVIILEYAKVYDSILY